MRTPHRVRRHGTADYSLRKSQALLERAKRVEALIGAQPGLDFSEYERIGGSPSFVKKASGPYLWDVDGNKYIDFILGYGSVVLGHADPTVLAAVHEALKVGCNPTLLSLSHLELAEKMVALCPSIEAITFLKTGSDATDAAVRLARSVTGRKHVFHWGFHGWHDWCAQSSNGVLDYTKSLTLSLRYNDLDQAESLFSKYGRDVACVILMPYEIDSPLPGYLEGLRNLSHRNGALFILDEIRSGFRISLGGAQEYFGVEADLVTYGKAMSNGHPISALAGRMKYMNQILDIGMNGTYYRTPDSMAAALATIDILEKQSGPARLATLGQRLKDGIDHAALKTGVAAHTIGFPSTPFIQFDYDFEEVCDRAMRLFCNGMLRRGVLLTPSHHWFVCTSMREKDIEQTVNAAADVFKELNAKI
jgi:glutamate-1-semialdehyde 2,1-aminomutase